MQDREAQDSDLFGVKQDYIDSRWRGLQRVVASSRTRVLNYLFVLNSGGLLGALTYISTKPKTDELYCSIWWFVAGLCFITIHAAFDYYVCERHFSKFRKDVDSFYKSDIDWEVMIDRDNQKKGADLLLHILGWLSGVAFIVGISVGIVNLPDYKLEPKLEQKFEAQPDRHPSQENL